MYSEEQLERIYGRYKVSEEMIKNILKDISEGSPNKHAAQANGISEKHFYTLLKNGESDLQKNRKETLAARFLMALRAIENIEIKECRKLIRESEKSHDGAEWTLEHAYWRHYSNNAPAKDLSHDIDMLRIEKIINKEDEDGKIDCEEA